MPYYSFVVDSKMEVPLPEHFVVIGEGRDTFNAVIKDLDAFRDKLRALGVTILQAHQLDELEAVPPTALPSADIEEMRRLPRG